MPAGGDARQPRRPLNPSHDRGPSDAVRFSRDQVFRNSSLRPPRRPAAGRNGRSGWLLLPYLVGTLVLLVIPTLATAALAFTEFSSTQPPVWVGLENFRRLITSELVYLALTNSLIFVGLAVPLRVVGALVFALVLQAKGRSFAAYRAAIYLPTIIPEAAYALVWLWIFNPIYGPLNLLLQGAGLPPIHWLTDPDLARIAIVILSAFQLGEGFVLLTAGLQTIPRALYEAAAIDGAGRWQAFWRITLPTIAPWLLLLTGRDILLSLQNTFAPSFIITYGGPYYATMFVPLLVYEMAFDYLELGLAAALILLVLVATGLLVLALSDLLLPRERAHG